MTEAIYLPISDIAWIDDLPYRETDNDHVKALVATNEPGQWPPIIVVPGAFGDGCHYGLIAGQHRLLAAMDLDRENILAEVKDYATQVQQYLAMWEDNARNGRPATIAERKEHAVRLHQMFPSQSYREIGRLAGLDDKTVKRVIVQSEAQEDDESDTEQRQYNAVIQKPAQLLISSLNKFVDAESNALGSKYGDRNEERRARALAKFTTGAESVQTLRSLGNTFNRAAQYVEEKLAATSGKK